MDWEQMDGILPISKPKGPTSHDIVQQARKVLAQKKIGHSGTLDPFAEGVLLLGIGKGTRILEYLTGQSKTYQMVFQLGWITDTYDSTGTTVEVNDPTVTSEQIRFASESFVGEYLQVPPMYSARKVQGVKLYELARQGKIINMPPRTVTIYTLEVQSINGNQVTIQARVSSGTYMRSLAMDIGYRLGCGATAVSLIRTENAGFGIDQCVPWQTPESSIDSLRKMAEETLVPLNQALSFLPRITIREEDQTRVKNGMHIFAEMVASVDGTFEKDQPIRIVSHNDELIAIASSERVSGFIRTLQSNDRNERVAKLVKVFA